MMVSLTKKALGGAAALALLAGAVGYGIEWWHTDRYLESTDDAYFKADYTTIAPKVSGYVSDVLVNDNEPVKQGQALARIDDRDFKVALAQVDADVDAANATLKNIDAQLAMQQAVVDQANAGISAADAGLAFARDDDARYAELAREHVATIQKSQQATAALRQQTAEATRSRAAAVAALRQIDVLKTERVKAETQLERVKATREQAELNVGYTTITAPIDGTVGARSIRVGQYVQAGTQLMAVVPLQSVYVIANFKETQLTHVRSGEPATVKVDSFPGSAIHGTIDSLSPASGLEFALLPPDNATGNFTKIVQRIPVKITLDPSDPLTGLLRPGMSVEATVDTKDVVLAAEQPKTQLAQR